jgi:hypothetical protein
MNTTGARASSSRSIHPSTFRRRRRGIVGISPGRNAGANGGDNVSGRKGEAAKRMARGYI